MSQTIIHTDEPQEVQAPAPQMAFVVHKGPGGGGMASLLTRHPIGTRDGQPVIGAGSLVGDEDLMILADVLREGASRRVYGGEGSVSLLAPDVLGLGPGHLVWRIRSAVRPMWFRIWGKPPFHLNVPWPNLIACASKRGLHVAAIRSSRRPTDSTRLHHAPLMNVYRTGSVCAGSVKLPESWRPEAVDAWNDVLFDSAFSHVNHNETLSTGEHVDDRAHLSFWKALHEANATRFPSDALRPMGKTLGEWLGSW